MLNRVLNAELTVEQLHELDRTTQLVQAIGPEFVRDRNQSVIYASQKWTHDDYLKLSVKWYKLARIAGLNTEQTRKWLQIEQQALTRLGITLD